MSDGVVTEDVRRGRRTSVASGAAILMVGFVLSRVLGLARAVIQASVLGASGHDAAAFTTAFAFPDVIFALVSGGALGSSFIPVFAGMLEIGNEDNAWRVASGVMNGVLWVMLTAVTLGELTAPWVVGVMARPADQPLTLSLTRIMLLQPLFLALSGILISLHNSYHRFVGPAIAPLIYNLANIAGLLLVPLFHHAVALAAWGVTIGALLQLLVLAPGLVAFRRLVQPGAGLGEPGTREVGRLMVPRIMGQAGSQLSVLAAVTLANLDFANRPSAVLRLSFNLMALPIGLFGGTIATAAFPTLSRQAARGDHAAFGESISRTLRTMLFLALPAAVGLMILRYPITAVLFHHGAFRPSDVDLVAVGLLGWGAGVPVLVAVELLPRAFFALKDTWTPVRVNLVMLALALVLSVLGAGWAHGNSLVGVAVLTGAFSLTVTVEALWLCLILRRRVATFALGAVGLSLLRSLVASGSMGAALMSLMFLWPHRGPPGSRGDIVLLLVAVPFGMVVYTGTAYVVRAPELAVAWTMLRERLGRHG